MVTPFGASVAWLRGEEKPVGKEFARCRIATGTLTVPVAGGAAVLKRRNANPVLSEHGKWRREHLGAWQAAYGRTPYYAHLMPQIEAVYNRAEGMRLEEFNRAMMQVAEMWIDREAITVDNPVLTEVREETLKLVDPSLSIFDAIFRLGKRTTFAL